MKRFLLPALLAVGMLFSVSGFSQTAVKLNTEFKLQLTESMLTQKAVTMDISDLQFTDEAAAVKYFHAIQNNLTDYTVDYPNRTAVMHLYPERLGKHTWTIADWNAYLLTQSTVNAETYKAFQISSPKN